jgi:hypothetical protein
MPIATFLLALLLFLSPASLVFSGPFTDGLIIGVVAVQVAMVAWRLSPGEAGFLAGVMWPFVLVAVIPALWMILQTLPLGGVGLADSIWRSAAEALGRPIAGSISVDPGATLLALAHYGSTLAVALVAAALAVDRYRAGRILFMLAATTTLVALFLLASKLDAIPILANRTHVLATDNRAAECAGLGVIITAAAVFLVFERSSANQVQPSIWYALAIAACLAAFALCSAAMMTNAENPTRFAVLCGIATLAAAILIRRFGLGPWPVIAIVATALVGVVAAIAPQPDNQKVGLLLQFATRAPDPMIALAHSILADNKWGGAGAGTFAAVIPIHRTIDELQTGVMPPTAVAAIAIELGRSFLFLSLIAALVFVAALLRSATRRGRDAIFSMAGASCVVTTMLFAFESAAMFSAPVSIIVAAIVGVAIAQSKSRSVR